MKVLLRISISLVALSSAISASADAPLPPPQEVHVSSKDRSYCVDSFPESDTLVRRCSSSEPLWSIPGWHRSIFVSNSGHVVIQFGGLNLLPVNYDPATVMIEIWKDGKQTHQLLLTDVIKNPKKLQRTSSHFYWGYVMGFNDNDELLVDTVDRGTIRIDLATGKQKR